MVGRFHFSYLPAIRLLAQLNFVLHRNILEVRVGEQVGLAVHPAVQDECPNSDERQPEEKGFDRHRYTY